MNTENKQIDFWKGDFGKEYTDRNFQTIEQEEKYYTENYGISRSVMNEKIIGFLNKDSKILEVGSNVGIQLMILQQMGFKNLYGIELQNYAVQKAKQNTLNINIIQGNGFDIPFKDNYFDLVYTSGVLIHIAPENLKPFMNEMERCSKKYIMGFEYYADEVTPLNYRGNNNFMWKADYSNIFLNNFSNLKSIKKEIFPYLNGKEKGNSDCFYLLEKV